MKFSRSLPKNFSASLRLPVSAFTFLMVFEGISFPAGMAEEERKSAYHLIFTEHIAIGIKKW